jgi:hypothetical protein
MSTETNPRARASHQRRPETYKATGRDGSIYFLDSIRPVTHAVIATRREAGPEYSTVACVGLEQAEQKAAMWRGNDYWSRVEVVPLLRPADTAGNPERAVERLAIAGAC